MTEDCPIACPFYIGDTGTFRPLYSNGDKRRVCSKGPFDTLAGFSSSYRFIETRVTCFEVLARLCLSEAVITLTC